MMVEMDIPSPPVRSVVPVEVWGTLPASLLLPVRSSLAPAVVKALFEHWGSPDGEIEYRGFVLTVDSGDPSVSTDFTNSQSQWCSLSLSADGLSLSISDNGERDVRFVPSTQLDQVEQYEDWFELVQLH